MVNKIIVIMLVLLTFLQSCGINTKNQLFYNEDYEINLMTCNENDTTKFDKNLLIIFLFSDFFNDYIIKFDRIFIYNQLFYKYILKKLLFVLSFP